MAARFEFTVPGIRCGRCASDISVAVANVEGVTSIEIDGQDVVVCGALLSDQEIQTAVLEAGFEAIR